MKQKEKKGKKWFLRRVNSGNGERGDRGGEGGEGKNKPTFDSYLCKPAVGEKTQIQAR